MKLYSRRGNDLTYRFSLIVESLARLRSCSCIIDGEAVCCDDKVLRSFISGWTEIRVVWACRYGVILRHCRARWAAAPTRHLAAPRRTSGERPGKREKT